MGCKFQARSVTAGRCSLGTLIISKRGLGSAQADSGHGLDQGASELSILQEAMPHCSSYYRPRACLQPQSRYIHLPVLASQSERSWSSS